MAIAPKALADRRDERSVRRGPAFSSRRRLAIVIVAAITVAVWAANSSPPWQSWSHDAFDGHLYAMFAAYRGSGPPDDLGRVGWVYRVVVARGTYVLTEF
jgi:hypothetical protein